MEAGHGAGRCPERAPLRCGCMAKSPRRCSRGIREADYRKLLKYSAVSAIVFPFTPGHAAGLHRRASDWSFVHGERRRRVRSWPFPAYLLNRYWVWGKKGKNRFTTEVLPFWVITLSASACRRSAPTTPTSGSTRRLAVNAGQRRRLRRRVGLQVPVPRPDHVRRPPAHPGGRGPRRRARVRARRLMPDGSRASGPPPRPPGGSCRPTRAWPCTTRPPAVAGGPFLEVGTYCGKSAVYLGAAAQEAGTVLFASTTTGAPRRTRPGWEHHEPDLVDPDIGRDGHAAALPPHHPRRRPGGHGRRRRRRLAHRRPRTGDAAGAPVHRRRPRPRAGAPRLRGLDPPRRARRPARHPRRVPRPRRRRPPAVRDLLPARSSPGAFDEVGATGSLRVLRRPDTGV